MPYQQLLIWAVYYVTLFSFLYFLHFSIHALARARIKVGQWRTSCSVESSALTGGSIEVRLCAHSPSACSGRSRWGGEGARSQNNHDFHLNSLAHFGLCFSSFASAENPSPPATFSFPCPEGQQSPDLSELPVESLNGIPLLQAFPELHQSLPKQSSGSTGHVCIPTESLQHGLKDPSMRA